MKFTKHILCVLMASGLLMGAASCSDVLDEAPDGSMEFGEIFRDPDKTAAFLNTCYNNLPQKGYYYWGWETIPNALSDDGWSNWDFAGEPVGQIYAGKGSASEHPIPDWAPKFGGLGNNEDFWNRYWQQIRYCTLFLENIDEAAVRSEAERDRMRAEAHVLRAYFYSELVKWYGQVPVLENSVAFDADFSDMRRNSVYEVAKFIETDCDFAIYSEHLPWRITSASEATRATKALAWTLKSKMMLFAASPLFNEGQNHWEEAYKVNLKAVEQLKENGYELFSRCTNPNTYGTGKAAALRQLINTEGDYAAEPRDRETIWQGHGYTCFVWHIGGIGSGMDGTYSAGTAPTQELNDAFNTTDGEPVLDLRQPYLDERHLQPNYNPRSCYDPQNPYANRDPRMDETLVYNGAKYKYAGQTYTCETFAGGKNHIDLGPTDDYTRTGYYHCKYIQPGAGDGVQFNVQTPPWKYFRLAEVILNLAEAAAEAGHLEDAKDAVDEIRARVGMPALPSGLSQEDMILRVRNERRVELAWEENRYWDVRRWKRPEENMHDVCAWLTGMRPIKQADGSFTYERYSIWDHARGGAEMRDKLLPIPLTESARLEAVTGVKWQNPGW